MNRASTRSFLQVLMTLIWGSPRREIINEGSGVRCPCLFPARQLQIYGEIKARSLRSQITSRHFCDSTFQETLLCDLICFQHGHDSDRTPRTLFALQLGTPLLRSPNMIVNRLPALHLIFRMSAISACLIACRCCNAEDCPRDRQSLHCTCVKRFGQALRHDLQQQLSFYHATTC